MAKDEHTNDRISVGRVVHYQGQKGCRAAMVIDVESNDPGSAVTLEVFEGGGQNPTIAAVPYEDNGGDEPSAEGTWHWPERV